MRDNVAAALVIRALHFLAHRGNQAWRAASVNGASSCSSKPLVVKRISIAKMSPAAAFAGRYLSTLLSSRAAQPGGGAASPALRANKRQSPGIDICRHHRA